MYITQILQYLLWPVMIIVTWFLIRFAVKYYEKRFPDKES